MTAELEPLQWRRPWFQASRYILLKIQQWLYYKSPLWTLQVPIGLGFIFLFILMYVLLRWDIFDVTRLTQATSGRRSFSAQATRVWQRMMNWKHAETFRRRVTQDLGLTTYTRPETFSDWGWKRCQVSLIIFNGRSLELPAARLSWYGITQLRSRQSPA
jgi:hypothetical protein